jgi:DNA-binding NarL/FixJ family response regulator
MLHRHTILLVDPSSIYRRQMKEVIEFNETLVDVVEADGVGQADDVVRNQPPDVVFLDVDLPHQEDGLRLIQTIREALVNCRIVVLTDNPSDACRAEARQRGANRYLLKKDATGLHLIDLIHEVIRR